MAKGTKITPRKLRFIAEYVIDLNATQAALRAGYSAKTAASQGQRLLKSVEVNAAIQEAFAKRSIRTGITADRVLAELEILAFSDVTSYEINETGNIAPTASAPPGAMRAISSIRYKITTDDQGRSVRDVELKLWDKPGPLKLAGRHVGLFPDRVEITGKDGGPVALQQSQKMTRAEMFREIERLEALAPPASEDEPADGGTEE